MRSDEYSNVADEIAQLQDLDLKDLRKRWRALVGRTAPAQLPRYLILRLLAYRLQAQAYGDLSRTTVLFLDGLAKSATTGVPFTGPVSLPNHGRLKAGTVLVREHGTKHHQIVVADDGFIWEGRTYSSLTKIARAITGTSWNGPRFFGLRDNVGRGE